MKGILLAALVSIAVPAGIGAKDIDVAFIGVTQGGAPAFEETLDRRIRENLSTCKGLAVTDYLQTQSFRKKVRFDEFPAVSRKLVEGLRQYTSDSAVFVWGMITGNTLGGKRSKAIRASLRGTLVLTLNIYSLRYKNYAFTGDVTAEAEKSKGFIFFGNAEKEIMVSAADREDVTGLLLDQAARKSASLIATVIESERLHAAKEAETAGAKAYEVPSVSDMFNMPSVEAASVSKGRKRPAMDAAPPQPQAKSAPPADTLSLSPKKPALPPAAPAAPAKADTGKDASKPGPAIDTVNAKGRK
jgi:hypothetical protein